VLPGPGAILRPRPAPQRHNCITSSTLPRPTSLPRPPFRIPAPNSQPIHGPMVHIGTAAPRASRPSQPQLRRRRRLVLGVSQVLDRTGAIFPFHFSCVFWAFLGKEFKNTPKNIGRKFARSRTKPTDRPSLFSFFFFWRPLGSRIRGLEKNDQGFFPAFLGRGPDIDMSQPKLQSILL
jgi:hypothetical protein